MSLKQYLLILAHVVKSQSVEWRPRLPLFSGALPFLTLFSRLWQHRKHTHKNTDTLLKEHAIDEFMREIGRLDTLHISDLTELYESCAYKIHCFHLKISQFAILCGYSVIPHYDPYVFILRFSPKDSPSLVYALPFFCPFFPLFAWNISDLFPRKLCEFVEEIGLRRPIPRKSV